MQAAGLIAGLTSKVTALKTERDEALTEHTDMMWQRRRADERAEAAEARLADATRLLKLAQPRLEPDNTVRHMIAAFLAGAGPRVEPVNDSASAFPNRSGLESDPFAGHRVETEEASLG